ncbi:MAG TPA: hypothetical protein DDW52_30150 [Planctomycetaceae bacterium]|nr:hypothetical protein [Planctomycetaceae bacterium]
MAVNSCGIRTALGSAVLGGLLVACSSCGPRENVFLDAEANPDRDLPLVTHPVFEHWNRFPKGSLSRSVRSSTAASEQVTTVRRLIAKQPGGVVIEHVVTSSGADKPTSETSQTFDIPSTFPLPDGMKLSQFELPALTAEEVGTETLTIAGIDFATTIYRWEESTEAGQMEIRYWKSVDVPGQMVKQVSKSPAGYEMTEVVTEVVVPAD